MIDLLSNMRIAQLIQTLRFLGNPKNNMFQLLEKCLYEQVFKGSNIG